VGKRSGQIRFRIGRHTAFMEIRCGNPQRGKLPLSPDEPYASPDAGVRPSRPSDSTYFAKRSTSTLSADPTRSAAKDVDRKVSDLYGMIHPNASDTMTVRSVFFIGPDKKVKAIITYPASTGRNFDELLRVIDSLQLTSDFKVATPVNWKQGDDVIIVPAVSDEEAHERFPDGWKAEKPYLRVVKQPAQ